MAGKVWSAEELERMTPAEQDALFASSVVTDLNDVPAAFLARVRARLEERITKRNTPHAS
jgi:hypothetical protein